MTQVDPTLLTILDDAMFLTERMADGSASGEAAQGALGARRLERWQTVLGGRAEALDERIESAGWSRATVEGVLSGQRGHGAVAALTSTPLPAWLLLLGRVLATSPDPRIAAALSSLPFGELFTGFVTVARETLRERLTRRASVVATDGVLRALELALAESISGVLSRCLLADFDAERPAAPALIRMLTGDNGDAFGDRCYRAFIARQRADNLRGLLTRYPVAARLAGTRFAMWIETSAEFLGRLAQDLPEIRRQLPGAGNHGSTDVVAVSSRVADPHEHGRSVAIVTFADGGKVVYKPRSLTPEAAWRAFATAIDPAYDGFAAKVIDRGAYGWMAYVSRRDLADRDAAGAFYRSAGAMLCLARALAMKDLHFENVVAAGDRLVPVDLETIAQSRWHSAARTPLERIGAAREEPFEDSIRDTHALPARYSLTNRPPQDVSALADLRMTTMRRSFWRGLGTDAIVQVFEEEAVAANNLPRLDGSVIPPDDYEDEIVAGFEAAWDALGRACDRLMAPDGLVDAIAAVPVRFIHRDTEIYYNVFNRAAQPEAMRSGIDFSIELEVLYRAVYGADGLGERRPLVEAEVDALHRGDIPRFLTPAGAREVLSEGTLLLDNAFARSGVETIRRRLSTLGPAARAAELRFVRASFHAARHGKSLAPADRVAVDEGPPLTADQALAAAIEIGREIVDGLTPRADGGASWIGVAYRAMAAGPAAVIVNESLYEGTTGIGVFLAALYRTTGERVWREAADSAFVDARRLAREVPTGEPIASALGLGLGGLGGMIYALTIASEWLEDHSLLADAASLAARIDAAAISEKPNADRLAGLAGAIVNAGPEMMVSQANADVVAGLAGAIPGLLALADTSRGAAAANAALACAWAIIRRAGGDLSSWGPPSSPGGYAHGVAGILATLALLADRDAQIRCAIDEALARSEASQPDPCESTDTVTRSPAGWCRGPVGVALAHLATRLRLGTGGDAAVAAIERAVDTAIADRHALDQVCCGLFGGIDALLVAARFDRPDLRDKAGRLAGAILARARRGGSFHLRAGLPPTFASPGFFQGTSGVGYTLLRLARPELLPSILMTEWRAGR